MQGESIKKWASVLRKTATEAALFSSPLAVTSLNRVYYETVSGRGFQHSGLQAPLGLAGFSASTIIVTASRSARCLVSAMHIHVNLEALVTVANGVACV